MRPPRSRRPSSGCGRRRSPRSPLVDDLAEEAHLLGAERPTLEEVRASLQRPPERRAQPPPADGVVVARGQDRRNAAALEDRRARVLRVFEEPARERLVQRASPARSRRAGAAGPRRRRRARAARHRSGHSRRSRARGRPSPGSARRRPRSAGRRARGGTGGEVRRALAAGTARPAGVEQDDRANPGGAAPPAPPPRAPGRSTIPAPPPYGASSTLRCRPRPHARRSWTRIVARPSSWIRGRDARRQRPGQHLREEGEDVDLERHADLRSVRAVRDWIGAVAASGEARDPARRAARGRAGTPGICRAAAGLRGATCGARPCAAAGRRAVAAVGPPRRRGRSRASASATISPRRGARIRTNGRATGRSNGPRGPPSTTRISAPPER